ncbi:hypothetical protein GOODEAATRI_017315, partial [Goodea atripinnis]
DKVKLSFSMKAVNQGTGQDLDPNNVMAEMRGDESSSEITPATGSLWRLSSTRHVQSAAAKVHQHEYCYNRKGQTIKGKSF